MPPPARSPQANGADVAADRRPRTSGRPDRRAALAVVIGLGLGAVLALIAGEYPFVGADPYVIAAAVPAVIGFAVRGIARGHAAGLWAATGAISAASVGWALWISTGRGVDPVPVGGWVAVALALAWPLAFATRSARRTEVTDR